MAQISTGAYLKAESLTEDGQAYVIDDVTQEQFDSDGGGQERKWVLHFKGLKPLILNATNIKRAVAALGTSETDEWIGQSLVAYRDPNVEYGGKIVGGVRLRAVPASKKKVAKAAVPAGDDIPF